LRQIGGPQVPCYSRVVPRPDPTAPSGHPLTRPTRVPHGTPLAAQLSDWSTTHEMIDRPGATERPGLFFISNVVGAHLSAAARQRSYNSASRSRARPGLKSRRAVHQRIPALCACTLHGRVSIVVEGSTHARHSQ